MHSDKAAINSPASSRSRRADGDGRRWRQRQTQGHGKVAFMQHEAALACAAGRGGGGGWRRRCCRGRSGAGDEVDDLDGLLALLRDRASQLGGAGELDPGRRERGLDGAAGTAAVARAHGRYGGNGRPGQLLQLPVQGRGISFDGHHVPGTPAEDDLRGVSLRV